MAFALFEDVTGTGTGDYLETFDTMEKAQERGEAIWTPECGYTVHDEEKAYPLDIVAFRKPTHPERDYPERPDCDAWDDLDPNEPPDLPQF